MSYAATIILLLSLCSDVESGIFGVLLCISYLPCYINGELYLIYTFIVVILVALISLHQVHLLDTVRFSRGG